ncbi:hypothetical protein TH30_00160 [Thalassospira profundimaris]|uniref:Lipoprotein n=2 Tax=Thalassospira profundimaris TaxID=502049 RepID=A0A367X5N7_9PROT|nr:hypothetical protein TH30_00160 [Thalassospira profundimaris]
MAKLYLFGFVAASIFALSGNSVFAQDEEVRGVTVTHPSFPVVMCDSGGKTRTCDRMILGENFPDQVVFYSHDSQNFGAYQIRFLNEKEIYWVPDDMIVVQGKEVARSPVVCGGDIGTLGGKGTRGAGADCVSAKGK